MIVLPFVACTSKFDLFAPADGGGATGEGGLGGGSGAPPPLVVTARDPARLASRYFHSCAISAGATLCWGRGGSGELGNGSLDSATPLRVAAPGLAFASIRAGFDFSCGRDATGTLFCWGKNDQGQLGRGHFDEAPELARVELPEPIVDFDLGFDFVCAVGASGTVYTWGSNQEYQLGLGESLGTGDARSSPATVVGAEGAARCVTGEAHACTLDASGGLRCWGRNGLGECAAEPADHPQVESPRPIEPERKFRAVAPGQFSTCAIEETRGLYCWGSDGFGQSLRGGVTSPTPALVLERSDLVDVQSNAFHTCFTTSAAELYCFGFNEWGEFGTGDQLPRPDPLLVSGTRDVIEFAASWQHICYRESTGAVWCSGRSGEGQIGTGFIGIATEFQQATLP